jgi:hypothetical protein
MATRQFAVIGSVLLAATAAGGCGGGSGEHVGATSSAASKATFGLCSVPYCGDEIPPGSDDSHPPGLNELLVARNPGDPAAKGAPWVVTGRTSGDSVSIPFFEKETSGAGAQYIVSQTWNAGGAGGLVSSFKSASPSTLSSWNPIAAGIYNNHEIGVWFGGSEWFIYNEDGSAIPSGASFSLLASPGTPGGAFTTVQAPNATSYVVTIPGSLGPSEVLVATHQWNPPGAPGVYDNHPLALSYLGGAWAVVHADKSAIPASAAFNVVSASAFGVPYVGGAVTVATASNTFGDSVLIGDKQTLAQPDAVLFVSSNLSKGGTLSCPIGVWYDVSAADWAVFCEDGSAMPLGVAFNVIVTHPQCTDAVQDGGETDIDCGGASFCARCDTKQHCSMGSDCLSGTCVVGLSGGFCAP